MENQFPPDPPDAVGRPSKLKGTAGFIIVTEFCERLAYYGFAGSLVLFFQVKLAFTSIDFKVFFKFNCLLFYVREN
jgi:dipeptide/tripeptide permease